MLADRRGRDVGNRGIARLAGADERSPSPNDVL